MRKISKIVTTAVSLLALGYLTKKILDKKKASSLENKQETMTKEDEITNLSTFEKSNDNHEKVNIDKKALSLQIDLVMEEYPYEKHFELTQTINCLDNNHEVIANYAMNNGYLIQTKDSKVVISKIIQRENVKDEIMAVVEKTSQLNLEYEEFQIKPE